MLRHRRRFRDVHLMDDGCVYISLWVYRAMYYNTFFILSHTVQSRNVLALNVKIINYILGCAITQGMLWIISGLQQDYHILSIDAILSWCCNAVSVPPVGILYGTMTLELGGKVTIECEKTKCFSELEFKLKVRLHWNSQHLLLYWGKTAVLAQVLHHLWSLCSLSLEAPALSIRSVGRFQLERSLWRPLMGTGWELWSCIFIFDLCLLPRRLP